MAYILEISFAAPFKFYPSTATPGKHFDDDWFVNRIKSFEKPCRYFGKCQKSDPVKLQVKCSFQPTFALKKCDNTTEPTTSGNFTLVSTDVAAGVSVWEKNIDMSGVAEGVYYPVVQASFLDVSFAAIAEPVVIKTTHPNTALFTFKNSLNDFGLVFSGIGPGSSVYQPEFVFRCEAAILEYEPDRERAAYRDQVLDTTTLSATPGRKFKLYIGTAAGVAPWVVDILNRIFCCDYVLIDGKQYETPDGSKWEIGRAKNYPMIGAAIELVEANNRSSMQLASEIIPGGGIQVAYDMQSDAFGTFNNPASTNPIQVTTVEP